MDEIVQRAPPCTKRHRRTDNRKSESRITYTCLVYDCRRAEVAGGCESFALPCLAMTAEGGIPTKNGHDPEHWVNRF